MGRRIGFDREGDFSRKTLNESRGSSAQRVRAEAKNRSFRRKRPRNVGSVGSVGINRGARFAVEAEEGSAGHSKVTSRNSGWEINDSSLRRLRDGDMQRSDATAVKPSPFAAI